MPQNKIEEVAKSSVLSVQNYALLSGRAVGTFLQRPRYLADFITQADSIGVGLM